MTGRSNTPTSGDSDAQLVARAVAGEQRAYELLVIKYQRRITRLAAHMVRDSELAQDIAQETFIRAWRALHQFRGEAQFSTWLHRIAVNTAKRALMNRARSPVLTEAALQAGREVRVVVTPEKISEGEAQMLARDISDRIEKEMTYPGQIKVTVIRETRSVEYAK